MDERASNQPVIDPEEILAGIKTWVDIETPSHEGEEPGILVLSHLDTVHPMGLIDEVLPWKRENDHVQGPGIYDMKAGAHMAYYAYQHLVRQGKIIEASHHVPVRVGRGSR